MAQVTFMGKFPFCPQVITDGSLVGQGTLHPVGFSESEMIELYWKNKTYSCSYSTSLTIDWTYERYNPDPPPDMITCTANFDSSLSTSGITQSVAATPESSLVCGNDNDFSFDMGNRAATITDSCGDPSYEYQEDYVNLYIYPSNTYYYNNLYYPYILIGAMGICSSDSANENLYPNLSFSGTATFLGKDITLYSFWNDGRFAFNPSATATYNITTTITCTDTWPYNP